MRTRYRLLLVALLMPTGLRGQPTAPPPADSLAGLGVLPTAEELRRSFDQASADEVAARLAADGARTQRERTQYLIDILKSEIDVVEKRLDLAKKEKREADQKGLENDKKGMELRLRVLEKWREVHDATIRTAEAKRDAAREIRKTGEAEQQLGDMRRARAGNPADSTARTAPMDEGLVRQVRRVADARRSEADARRTFAERMRDLADRQKDLLDAQVAVREFSASNRI
jgi:hypothetical protein